jgi:restriction system protein
VPLSQAELNRVYDDLLYQIALRSLHELFRSDTAGGVEAIVFNGWVKSIDKATGKEIMPCVLTVQTTRSDFVQLNLERVEPKLCFKALRGIANPKLHTITPVAPIMKIQREDRRFVASYAVAASLDDATNIAAMDWEDFEHLVRELFEKEFAQAGGEVRVTRASRDWGVDAVVFDPDPIRGGKIVIQAKRYTNTVDVSSIRDLYGTVINEGAAKGILVTTADFGPEAHQFAKGKPLTLLNGNNLLHLLAKHGHKAKIDLHEARKLMAEEKRVQNAPSQANKTR